MIKPEPLIINGRAFIKKYSSEHRYLERDGAQYTEAIDPADHERQYTEGDFIPVGPQEPEEPNEEEVET